MKSMESLVNKNIKAEPKLIELRNIHKVYHNSKENQVHALNNVSLEVKQGDFLAIQGTSGSGKTTLLNILGFLDNVSKGEYLFQGENVVKLNDSARSELRNKEIGFVLQDFALLEDETALYNVCLPLLFTKENYSRIKEKASEILDKLGLQDRKEQLVKNLSGGQKQRVAIARSLIIEPSIILADEPTGSLDSDTSSEIMALLQELNKEQGVTIIMVTHDDNVASYAKQRLRMKDGQFVV